MKKSYPTLLATLVWATIYAQPAYADLASQCLLGVPVYNKPLVQTILPPWSPKMLGL